MSCKLLKDFRLFYLMGVLLSVLIVFFIGYFLYGEEELTRAPMRFPIVWGICYAYQELFYLVYRYMSPVVHFDFKKIKKVVHLIKKSYI